MADFNDIRDYAEERGVYSLLSRFLGTGNLVSKLFWIALFLVIGIFILIWICMGIFNADYNDTWGKLKLNDSVYIDKSYFTDTIHKNSVISRLVRPINGSDIDTMKIANWKKLQMKNALDTTLKPQLISYDMAFDVDSMYKNHSAGIGTYLRSDSVLENGFISKWFIIKPNLKVVVNVIAPDQIPKGYILANTDCYFPVSLSSVEQAEVFKKK